jgi:hypothetical protein
MYPLFSVSVRHFTYASDIAQSKSAKRGLVRWCPPMIEMKGNKKYAIGRLLEKMPHIKLGKVDCDAEPALCDRQAVRSFPTIRLYPLGTGGSSRNTPYTQYHR